MSDELFQARHVGATCPAPVAAPPGSIHHSPTRWLRRLVLTGALGVGCGVVMLAASQSAMAEELATVAVEVGVTDELTGHPSTGAQPADDLTGEPRPASDPAPAADPGAAPDPAVGSAPEPERTPALNAEPVDAEASLPVVETIPGVQPGPGVPAPPAVQAAVAPPASSPTSAGAKPTGPSSTLGRPVPPVASGVPTGVRTSVGSRAADAVLPHNSALAGSTAATTAAVTAVTAVTASLEAATTWEKAASTPLNPAGPPTTDRTDAARSPSTRAIAPADATARGSQHADVSSGWDRGPSAAVDRPVTHHRWPAPPDLAPPGPAPAVVSAPGTVLIIVAVPGSRPQPVPAQTPPLPMGLAVAPASCSSGGVHTTGGTDHRGLPDGSWAVHGPDTAPLLAGAPVRHTGTEAAPAGDAVDPGAGPPD